MDRAHAEHRYIELTEPEIQSGIDRVRWAELLIRQLPAHHEGRNSWLRNFAQPGNNPAEHDSTP